MYQRTLGVNGPPVGSIGLGGMPLSVKQDRPGEADAVKVLTLAAELGMTLWDTADAYALDDTETGHNERLFGKARAALPAEMRARLVIATKGGHVRPGGRWETDGRPEHLKEAVDASLKALQMERIDLYQFHRPDPKVPFSESIEALAQIARSGKVRFVGLSNVSAEQIDYALSVTPILSVQNHYSPVHRAPEFDGVLAKCKEKGIAFLPYSPLGGMGGAKNIGQSGVLAQVAQELGVSPQQVVLAWHLCKYEFSIPIPGVSRLESVRDSAEADNVYLSPEQMARLDESFA